jgi:hypothetical protein
LRVETLNIPTRSYPTLLPVRAILDDSVKGLCIDRSTSLSCSLALHLSLPLVKRNIPLDFIHALQWLRIKPRRVFYFRLVGCNGVVACIAFVRTVRFRGGGCEVRLGDCVGWELLLLEGERVEYRRREEGEQT